MPRERKEDKSSNVTTHTNTLAWSRQLEAGEVGVSTVSAWLKLPALPLTPPGLINLTCIGSTPRDTSAAHFPEVDERTQQRGGRGQERWKRRDTEREMGKKGPLQEETENKPDQTCRSAHQRRTNPCFQVLCFQPFMLKTSLSSIKHNTPSCNV